MTSVAFRVIEEGYCMLSEAFLVVLHDKTYKAEYAETTQPFHFEVRAPTHIAATGTFRKRGFWSNMWREWITLTYLAFLKLYSVSGLLPSVSARVDVR